MSSIKYIKEGTRTQWENGKIAEFNYIESEISYRIRELINWSTYKNERVEIGPVIVCGFAAYLIKNVGKSETDIYTSYYKQCLSRYKATESQKPGAYKHDLDSEFYSIHLKEENEKIKKSEVIFSYLTVEESELVGKFVENYFDFIKSEYRPKEPEPVNSPLSSDQRSQKENGSNNEKAIREHFEFMNGHDARKHRIILESEDYMNFITWTTSYFDNDFTIPEISNPIKKVNTAKGNVIFSFKEFFKSLYPVKEYPDSLFELIKTIFFEYRDDNIKNMGKTKEPQYYKQLINKGNY